MSNIPLKRGMFIRHQNHVYIIDEFHERHTGKQKPTVHVHLRDLRDGRPFDRSLADLLPIVEVEHAYRRMQYLYPRSGEHVFMDAETFEEMPLTTVHLHGTEPFLNAGDEYRVMFIDGAPAAIEMPEIVPLKVALTADPGHSVGLASNITKEATLDNGLEVRVPLFIKTGDLIRIDTRTRAYAGKEQT